MTVSDDVVTYSQALRHYRDHLPEEYQTRLATAITRLARDGKFIEIEGLLSALEDDTHLVLIELEAKNELKARIHAIGKRHDKVLNNPTRYRDELPKALEDAAIALAAAKYVPHCGRIRAQLQKYINAPDSARGASRRRRAMNALHRELRHL